MGTWLILPVAIPSRLHARTSSLALHRSTDTDAAHVRLLTAIFLSRDASEANDRCEHPQRQHPGSEAKRRQRSSRLRKEAYNRHLSFPRWEPYQVASTQGHRASHFTAPRIR